jgi:hypothetical protein
MKLTDPRIQTDSKVSSMRWTLVVATKVVLTLASATIATALAYPFVVALLRPTDTVPALDLVGITALLSLMTASFIVGKVGQSFAEKDTTNPPDNQ